MKKPSAPNPPNPIESIDPNQLAAVLGGCNCGRADCPDGSGDQAAAQQQRRWAR